MSKAVGAFKRTQGFQHLDAKHLGEYSLGCARENRRSMPCRVVLTAPKAPTAGLFPNAFA